MKRIVLCLMLLTTCLYARQKSSYAVFFGTCTDVNITSGYNLTWLLGSPSCAPESTSSSPYPNGILMPSAGTLSNLYISGPAGAYTVYVNNVSTALTCTIGTGSYSTQYPQCSDTTDDVDVNANDLITLWAQPYYGGHTGTIAFSFEKQ